MGSCPKCNGALKRADEIEPPDQRGVKTQNVRLKCMLCTRVFPVYTSTVRVEKARENFLKLRTRVGESPLYANKLSEARQRLIRFAREDGVLLPPSLR